MDSSVFYWSATAAIGAAALALTIYNTRRWPGAGRYLCDDCRFNSPTDCLKVERPKALKCTAYRTAKE